MTTLFTPFTLGSRLQLANRVVMAPMTRSLSKKHIPSKETAAYYRRRAEGGVGLIITEGCGISHKASHGYPDVPNFYGKEALDGWKHVVDEVHSVGGKIIPQLWHVGSVRQRTQCKNDGVDNPQAICSCERNVPGYGPSAVAHPSQTNGDIPHVMTVEDIEEVKKSYAQASLDAKNLGFDGVELHGAHGYLIDQFFWDVTNKREDKYGGKTLAERTLFAVEIIQEIRKKVGPDFPIILRFSQWKLGDYKAKLAQTPEELKSFLTPLANAGVDIFHCSNRRFWEPEFPGSHLNLAGWTKKLSGRPTITVGSVGLDNDFISSLISPSEQEAVTDNTRKTRWDSLNNSLKEEEYDLVAVGRALLGDSAWAKKIEEKREKEIKPFSPEVLQTLQ